ncbi:MAG: Ornithine carbamoyltransferase [Syntrophomonadaceae bacterium]|nr:Ornithine carbamoyltransferase [Bacillota bacterium]
MKIKHFKMDQDFSYEEIWQVFRLARELKEKQKRKEPHQLLRGKSLAMIFQKPSTRTRVSFEVAMTQLGGHALYLSAPDLQLGRGETIADTAKVLSRYVDAIMARVFAHQDIVVLAQNSTVPVINGLSDEFHPCQALTDLFTIWEKYGSLKGLTLTFVGDGDNNVTNSLFLFCARLGVNFRVGCPKKYQTRPEILEMAKKDMKKNEVKIEILNDPKEAVKNADIIYTDTWVSMGRKDVKKREKDLSPYQVNKKLISLANENVKVMHCLPAHRNQEITDEVMDGPHSIIFDQAENRLHVQKALLVFLLTKFN